MAEKGLNRLTVYKLATPDMGGVKIPSYKPAAKGKVTVEKQQVSYKLLLYKKGPYPPSWFSTFDSLKITLPEKDWPETMSSGFVLLVHVGKTVYAVTGGVGHIHLRSNVAIEHRFGIELAQRMLALANLRGLVQRDTSGVVNTIDRGFRAKYDPKGDLNNLRRVLKNVRGAFAKKDPLYKDIGSSIHASDALSVNGRKDFTGVLTFLIRLENVWLAAPKQLSIPQLEHINKKAHGPLMDALEAQLIAELVAFDADTSQSLFLDNRDIGFLPDRATAYHLIRQGNSTAAASYQEVLEHVRDSLSQAKPADRRATYRDLRLQVDFEEGFSETHLLSYFLCGDITCKGDVFFLDNEEWFRASEEFIAALTKELDNIECVDPAALGVLEWNHKDEDTFNNDHTKLCVLDRRLVKVAGEKGGIEFCDLLANNNGRVQLIHVKSDSGAALRALFAQGFVSAQLYNLDAEFQTKVHTGDLQQSKGSGVSSAAKQQLAALADRHLREITIVFAIHDSTASHSVAIGANVTSKVLKGTLSTFAKADLLNRATDLRAMGYEVAVCRIRPYPTPKKAKKTK